MHLLKGIITFVLVIILMILEVGLGLMLCSKNFISEEAISESIQEINIEKILTNNNGEATPTAIKVYDILEHANINKSDANVILNDSSFKKIVGDLISSATMRQIDKSVEIKYPSESDIVDLIYNNFDALKSSYKIEKSRDEISKERIREEVHKYYDTIIVKLQEYLERLGDNND